MPEATKAFRSANTAAGPVAVARLGEFKPGRRNAVGNAVDDWPKAPEIVADLPRCGLENGRSDWSKGVMRDWESETVTLMRSVLAPATR